MTVDRENKEGCEKSKQVLFQFHCDGNSCMCGATVDWADRSSCIVEA